MKKIAQPKNVTKSAASERDEAREGIAECRGIAAIVAAEILTDCARNGVTAPSPRVVAKRLALPIYRAESPIFENSTGTFLAQYRASIPAIVYDARLSDEAREAAVAHELGHHAYRTKGLVLRDEEAFAVAFADALVAGCARSVSDTLAAEIQDNDRTATSLLEVAYDAIRADFDAKRAARVA